MWFRSPLLIEAAGKHKIVLKNRSSDTHECALGLDVVPAQIGAAEKLTRIMSHWHSPNDPGGALSIAYGGKPVFTGAFGSANVEHAADVTETTVFDTASLAKHVTGLAIAMLVNAGKISLDDDIRTYVPEVPDFGPTITIRHLLHHTSGLRDFPGLMILGDWHDYDIITLQQVLSLVEKQQDLNFPPGSEYTYSNTGYSLLAEIVARVSGSDLGSWADENLFQPLSMKQTRFLRDFKSVVPNLAHGYSLANQKTLVREPNNLAAMGSSSFLTTAHDMGIWMSNFDAKTVGGESVANLLTVRGRSNDGHDLGYGFGVGHGEYRGIRKIEHSGASGGFRSHMMHFPDQRFSVAVFSNQGNFDPGTLARLASKLYLGNRMKRPTRKVAKTKSTHSKTVNVDVVTLDRYTGSYQIQPGEVVQVSREGNTLKLRPKGHPDAPPIVSRALSQTRFTGPPNGSIEFVPDGNGIVTEAIIRDGDRVVARAERLAEAKGDVDLAIFEGNYVSPELGAEYEVALLDGRLVAKLPKRVRRLSMITSDSFATDDGINIEFVRQGKNVREFKATTGPRVRNVRFIKVKE